MCECDAAVQARAAVGYGISGIPASVSCGVFRTDGLETRLAMSRTTVATTWFGRDSCSEPRPQTNIAPFQATDRDLPTFEYLPEEGECSVSWPKHALSR